MNQDWYSSCFIHWYSLILSCPSSLSSLFFFPHLDLLSSPGPLRVLEFLTSSDKEFLAALWLANRFFSRPFRSPATHETIKSRRIDDEGKKRRKIFLLSETANRRRASIALSRSNSPKAPQFRLQIGRILRCLCGSDLQFLLTFFFSPACA